ncbi:hypothetical protein [Sphingomonas sp.]|uniref:hypothetical protein n=1 Tax=Sphingomonas sp. TaxID=28214 RepID=UPI003B007A2A
MRTEADILGASQFRTLPRNALASNMGLRWHVGAFGIDMFAEFAAQNPQRRFMLVTLISDGWLAYDCDTFIYLGGMQAASTALLNQAGFDGWAAIAEIQTLDESKKDLGRILLPNVHAIAWTMDPTIELAALERQLQASPELKSATSAATVTIEHRADTSPTNLMAYLLKNAALAKRRVPSRHSLSGLALGDCALRPASAVRQHEILSRIYLSELIFAGGEGLPLKDQLDHEVDRCAPFHRGELSTDAAAMFWKRLRQRHGRDEHYYPVAIDRSPAQLPCESPISLAASRFYRPTRSAA